MKVPSHSRNRGISTQVGGVDQVYSRPAMSAAMATDSSTMLWVVKAATATASSGSTPAQPRASRKRSPISARGGTFRPGPPQGRARCDTSAVRPGQRVRDHDGVPRGRPQGYPGPQNEPRAVLRRHRIERNAADGIPVRTRPRPEQADRALGRRGDGAGEPQNDARRGAPAVEALERAVHRTERPRDGVEPQGPLRPEVGPQSRRRGRIGAGVVVVRETSPARSPCADPTGTRRHRRGAGPRQGHSRPRHSRPRHSRPRRLGGTGVGGTRRPGRGHRARRESHPPRRSTPRRHIPPQPRHKPASLCASTLQGCFVRFIHSSPGAGPRRRHRRPRARPAGARCERARSLRRRHPAGSSRRAPV
jgi:hypothetical protein